MGLDYIRRETGRPWRKQWNASADRLKNPTLFDLPIREVDRFVSAELEHGMHAKVGETYVVQRIGSEYVVTDGLTRIAHIPHPPLDMTEALATAGGYAEAVAQRISAFGGSMELYLK